MDGHLRYYIDGAANQKNWMKFVGCARHAAEQNLVLVQQECSLYYEATRVITEGVELKVWYGDGYREFMGIPLGLEIGPEGDDQMMKRHECDIEMVKCQPTASYPTPTRAHSHPTLPSDFWQVFLTILMCPFTLLGPVHK